MKHIFFVFVIFLLFSFATSYADSDYVNDYTLIDCIDGDDNLGLAFDSSKPYMTLKAGIEETISYINDNINKSGNQESASGAIFNIKVNCSANDLLEEGIRLDFNGETYNNELLIEGVGDNGLIVQSIYFLIPNNSGKIIFKNAKFLDNSKFGYYFKIQSGAKFKGSQYKSVEYDLYNFYGIKIIDSYLKLKKATQISSNVNYSIFYSVCSSYCTPYNYSYSYYFSQVILKNSILEFDISGNYNFKMPYLIKDSKLNFINTSSGSFDMSFLNDSNIASKKNYGNNILVSNELDLGGNIFKTEDSSDIAFINNKFSNFSSFDFSGKAIYFNNTIENKQDINISNSKNLINNVFENNFIDTYDINNLRKNYKKSEDGAKGISWLYRIKSPLSFFDIELTSSFLYEEILAKKIPENKDGVYIIYNK